jgi:hypothetical protein
MTIPSRGLSLADAMAYVGVKRRTFDARWRPRLVALQQGVTTIFDRQDLDRLFDESSAKPPATSSRPTTPPQ